MMDILDKKHWNLIADKAPPKHERILIDHDGMVSIGTFCQHEPGVHDAHDEWEVEGSPNTTSPRVLRWRHLPKAESAA